MRLPVSGFGEAKVAAAMDLTRRPFPGSVVLGLLNILK